VTPSRVRVSAPRRGRRRSQAKSRRRDGVHARRPRERTARSSAPSVTTPQRRARAALRGACVTTITRFFVLFLALLTSSSSRRKSSFSGASRALARGRQSPPPDHMARRGSVEKSRQIGSTIRMPRATRRKSPRAMPKVRCPGHERTKQPLGHRFSNRRQVWRRTSKNSEVSLGKSSSSSACVATTMADALLIAAPKPAPQRANRLEVQMRLWLVDQVQARRPVGCPSLSERRANGNGDPASDPGTEIRNAPDFVRVSLRPSTMRHAASRASAVRRPGRNSRYPHGRMKIRAARCKPALSGRAGTAAATRDPLFE
jgi:hypothetical protein